MRAHGGHTVLRDGLVGVVVAAVSWGVAHVGRVPDLEQRRGPGGPWRQGPGSFEGPPDVAFESISWGIYPFLALLVVGVALRRVRPVPAFLTVVVATAGYVAVGGPYGPVLVAPALAVHSLATRLPFRRWAPLCLLLVPMMMAGAWDQPYLGLLDPSLYGALVTGCALILVPALFGVLHRDRRESERVEREQELRRYAYEERLQIARDVHDVVGHSLSVISLQAGVALHVLHKRPHEVEVSLEAIKRTSREALAELRTTLAVFRDPGVDEPLAPRPGLARLDELLSALRTAGREVSVQREESTEPVPAAVDQAAYRIVQEALTNVLRHAGDAPASVTIRRPPGLLLLEVTDQGEPISLPAFRPGNGVLGMRERAEAVGGTLTAGPMAAGGVRVQAILPLNASGGEP